MARNSGCQKTICQRLCGGRSSEAPGAWQRGSKPSSTRRPPGMDTTKATNRPTSSVGPRQSCSSETPATTQSGRTRSRGPNQSPTSGGRIEGAWRGQPRSLTNQGSVEEGTRPVSRVACGRKIGFNIEVHPEISGEMQAELGREQTLLQQALVSLERLRDEAANSVSETPYDSRLPQAQMDVEDPEKEIRRLRAQSCSTSEWRGTKRRRVVPRRLGFCPHQRWNWPHCIQEQQDHAARQTCYRTS